MATCFKGEQLIQAVDGLSINRVCMAKIVISISYAGDVGNIYGQVKYLCICVFLCVTLNSLCPDKRFGCLVLDKFFV